MSSDHIIVTPLVSLTLSLHYTTVQLNSVSQTRDSGIYTCEALVSADPMSAFVLNASGSSTESIIPMSKFLNTRHCSYSAHLTLVFSYLKLVLNSCLFTLLKPSVVTHL